MKKIFNKKNSIVFVITLLVLAVFVVFGDIVNAQDDDGKMGWGLQLIAGIAHGAVSVLGWILAKLMSVLIYVAQYNNFTGAGVINKGWIVARDVANMFFIVILLIIAFATILGIEKYNYKKWLPKLILMAVLINFSKTICGLLIDVSQVVMLTFVNAFSTIGAGNLTEMLGIADWRSLKGYDLKNVTGWEVTAGLVLAVIYAFIALATVAAMVAMLVMRIIMIWVYVVLSPFAYLLGAFPDGASYASKWWSEFSKNLIIGPVLAFFIWLSFAALGTPTDNTNGYQALGEFSDTREDVESCITRDEEGNCVNYGTSNLMIQFIVSIAMLLGGMKIAQEIGGAGGSVAGKTFGKVKSLGMMGAGAAGGALGYNFAKRRFTNWRQESKKASQAKSDLVYETVKGRTKGVVTGLAVGTGRLLSGKTPTEINKAREEKEKKANKKANIKERLAQVDEARYEAFQNDKYKDPTTGKEYEWDEKKKRYMNNGEVASYKDADDNVQEVTRMNNFKRGFEEQMRDHTTKARALKNQMNDEKMSAKQKLFESAGTSTVDLKRIMQDGSANGDKRKAAAIELAIKEGFKNADLDKGRQEVAQAKRLLGDNQPLLDKFNEKINKRFAALNFDVTNEAGASEYKAAMADGRVDGYKQDASTYNDEVVEVLRDYSGKDFGKKYGEMMSLSKDHNANGMSALRGAKTKSLQKGKKMYDEKSNELDPYAKLLAKNGDIEGAFNNSKDPNVLNFDDQSVNAFKGFLKTASAKDLKNMDNDYFDQDKLTKSLNRKGVSASASEIKNMQLRIKETIGQEIDVQKLASLEFSDENSEFVRRSIGFIKEFGTDTQKDLLKDNNVLKEIKAIK